MKKSLYKALVVTLYLLSFLILLFCIRIRFIPNIYLYTNYRLLLLLLVCVFIYLGGYILIKEFDYNRRILKINLIIYFLIYTVTICTLTLFDEIYGRQGFTIIYWNKDLLKYYLSTSFNIIPFKTIHLFITGYLDNLISLKSLLINVLGNFVAFMPFAIFKSMNKYKNFLITMVITVIIIEILQFITMSGICDIDDLILNVLGASIIYFVSKIKFINKLIYEFFLYER